MRLPESALLLSFSGYCEALFLACCQKTFVTGPVLGNCHFLFSAVTVANLGLDHYVSEDRREDMLTFAVPCSLAGWFSVLILRFHIFNLPVIGLGNIRKSYFGAPGWLSS